MANAARVHAVERGKDLEARTLIAFGGAAPLHAARLADKLGICRVLIPSGAGVGSAFGFLRAPVAYEVARSRYVRLDDKFDPDFVNALFDGMRAEAEAVVRAGAPDAALVETRAADMRYTGQGHEITVGLPLGRLDKTLKPQLVKSYERDYAAAFGRTIPGLDVEIMNWTLRLAATAEPLPPCPPAREQRPAKPRQTRPVFAPDELVLQDAPIFHRDDLAAGDTFAGPAVITEIETTTIVPKGFRARIDPLGSIVLDKELA
jgi:N-methylhydantoinase A